jgi:hypothetical protein
MDSAGESSPSCVVVYLGMSGSRGGMHLYHGSRLAGHDSLNLARPRIECGALLSREVVALIHTDDAPKTA